MVSTTYIVFWVAFILFCLSFIAFLVGVFGAIIVIHSKIRRENIPYKFRFFDNHVDDVLLVIGVMGTAATSMIIKSVVGLLS